MDEAIDSFSRLFAKTQRLIHLVETKERWEKKLMVPLARQWGVPNVTRDLTLSEVQVISIISQTGLINVTKLAEKTELTKGAITKICVKLLRRGWIERMPKEDNLKEVHYRATSDGNIVYNANVRYQEMEQLQFSRLIASYSDEELRFMDQLMTDAAEALKRGIETMEAMITNRPPT